MLIACILLKKLSKRTLGTFPPRRPAAQVSTPSQGPRVHELSIAQSLLEIVQDESKKHGIHRVNSIKIRVGALAGVVAEALTFCFGLVSQETIASGATLEIETIPLVARCSDCDLEFEVRDNVFLCPRCGTPTPELVSGRDLAVASIEGETGEENDPD